MPGWDVIVVGGGVVGTATARAVASLGRSCLLLERFDIGHALGSSHGPTRIFRLAYHHPSYVRMARAALSEWRTLEAEAGEELLVTTGGLDAGPGAPVAASALEAAGETFDWVARADAAERWPGLRLEGAGDLLFQPDAGVCLADRAVSAQLRLARAGGASVREHAAVTAVIPRAGNAVEVRTDDGAERASAVVVAAGAWTAPLVRAAHGASLTLRVSREQVTYFELDDEAALPTLIEWGSPARYAVPDPSRPGSLKAAEHMTGPEIDPDRSDRVPDEAVTARVVEWAGTRFPAARPVGAESCLYSTTPDEDFVLDRFGPVVVGSACSGHGFKFAPLVGRILSSLACGEAPDGGEHVPKVDLAMFSSGRPALRSGHG